jgi:uncharacterized protein YqcC (DUF446 family)
MQRADAPELNASMKTGMQVQSWIQWRFIPGRQTYLLANNVVVFRLSSL